VTTRILVVDMLSGRLPGRWVAGVVVLNAHRVTDTSGDGFAVRLFRAANAAGFVRAFSDAPTSFAGFNKVNTSLETLQALWSAVVILANGRGTWALPEAVLLGSLGGSLSRAKILDSDQEAEHWSGLRLLQVEKVMKALYVRKLFLWPRFQATVKEALEDRVANPSDVRRYVCQWHLHRCRSLSMSACRHATA